ncbi:PAS domain S-box protein [Chryseosolibacter indicus]|uniref:histidine kinase n=1 Tax=Chryseosolibacter indicus TaxID=2782351 RepID=A0ABS5W2C2_9BACT|nr:PAS domain S-box protein [Chryseosolibacter indicus]MBT1706411.1 PAS domain S-box protein [Chryseosolibacter indicus]
MIQNTVEVHTDRDFLASIVDSSQDSVVTMDLNSIITSWNKAAQDLYGYSASDAIGKSLSLIVLPEDIRQLFKDIDRIAHNNVVERFETVRPHKDGTMMNLEIVFSPVRNSFNRIIGVSCVARNITERKRIQKALQESETRFRAIVNQASVGIFQTDLEGKLTLVNERTCDLLAYKPKELIGKSIFDFTLAQDSHLQRQIFGTIINGGKRFETEKRVLRKDGSVRWVSESVTAILDEHNTVISTIGVILDITDRKELEHRKDEFIAVASHEIKTPLTSLTGYGQILEEKLKKSESADLRNLVHKLNRQTEKLQRLTAHLLDTTRITEGALMLHREWFDLNGFIAETVEQFRESSAKHQFVFRAGNVGKTYADKMLIGEVLNNLITNVIKYSPEGGKVTLATHRTAEGDSISVTDEGIGIAETSLNHVFDRFFRVEGGNRVSGLGLGLYISAGIIRSHGGQINVKSKIGQGSVFNFSLPLVIQSVDESGTN